MHFVMVDLDLPLSRPQLELARKYYRGYIPHVVVLDGAGNPVYNQSGEVGEEVISGLFDRLLR